MIAKELFMRFIFFLIPIVSLFSAFPVLAENSDYSAYIFDEEPRESLLTQDERREIEVRRVLEGYTNIVRAVYSDALGEAKKLQYRVDQLLAQPTEDSLELARQAWIKARYAYGQAEVFRYYGGPIDFFDEDTQRKGPEQRINAWPINEAYVDYVLTAEKSGIVYSPNVELTADSLIRQNQYREPTNVSTGYHVIEFLLWGQDLSFQSAGERPSSDYLPGDFYRERRRTYLKKVTDLLVADLEGLVDEWSADKYSKTFIEGGDKSVDKILRGLSYLCEHDMAEKRMEKALETSRQVDEESQFSDNTHNDFLAIMHGVRNVYFGEYRGKSFSSLHQWLEEEDKDTADKIAAHIAFIDRKLSSLPTPFDREVLSALDSGSGRLIMQDAIGPLKSLSHLFQEMGEILHLQTTDKSRL